MSGGTGLPHPALAFKLLISPSTSLSPRLGLVQLTRSPNEIIELNTPGLFLHTSRGHIPHLSGDHVSKMAKHLPWLHASLESFLETLPPTPTLQPGLTPLHTFFGVSPARHILSLSCRDPADTQLRPPNGDAYISGVTVRGVRKLDSPSYRTYTSILKPDIIIALSDVPFTPAPYSQKRITKSIDRTVRWLSELVKEEPFANAAFSTSNILVNLVGGTSQTARRIFAESLLGPVEEGSPLSTAKRYKVGSLNDRISGYVLETAPLRAELAANAVLAHNTLDAVAIAKDISTLLEASLAPLPSQKMRLAHSVTSPHEMLQLIVSCGVDLFDCYWAQKAADWGVALDFTFPVTTDERNDGPVRRSDGKQDVGHNLYSPTYAYDFQSLLGRTEVGSGCMCLACGPTFTKPIIHGKLERAQSTEDEVPAPEFTRAYIHHLLHTHEMSAHALLVSHNILVLQAFFTGVRSVLRQDPGKLVVEFARFQAEYDGEMRIMKEARERWEEVDLARGKGRLARERKMDEGEIGTAPNVVAKVVNEE